jgi:circadian clock protein KaiC
MAKVLIKKKAEVKEVKATGQKPSLSGKSPTSSPAKVIPVPPSSIAAKPQPKPAPKPVSKAESKLPPKLEPQPESKPAVEKAQLKEKPLTPEIVPSLARVASGIPGFDELCHGGLPEISTVMVSGGSGTGKTMFATQALFHAATLGKKVLYFTFSEPVYKVVNFASNLKFFDLSLIDQGKFKIIDLGPMSAKITDKNTAEEIITQVVDLCKTFKPRMVAIDPVTMVGYLAKTELNIRQATLALGNALSELGITTILCSEAPLSESGYSRFGVEEYMADMIVFLRHEPFIAGKSTGMTLEIVKMRGSTHEAGKCYYTIDEKGMTVLKRRK